MSGGYGFSVVGRCHGCHTAVTGECDSGKSFVYRLAWPNGTPGQVNYNGRIIGFSRETFTVQLHGEFGDVVNPDVNSVVLVYFDHGGTEYARKTFQFKDGKYQPVS